ALTPSRRGRRPHPKRLLIFREARPDLAAHGQTLIYGVRSREVISCQVRGLPHDSEVLLGVPCRQLVIAASATAKARPSPMPRAMPSRLSPSPTANPPKPGPA